MLLFSTGGAAAATASTRIAGIADHELTWWWKPHNTTVAAELAYVLQHADLITGVILYCQWSVLDDGTFGLWPYDSKGKDFGDNTACPAVIDAMHEAGIATQVIVSMGDNNSTAFELAFKHAEAFAVAMLAVSEKDSHYQSPKLSGWNFDFEGEAPIDLYAPFLGTVRKALAPHGLTVTVCGSAGGNRLDGNLTKLARATDGVYDMGSYHANSKANFQLKLNSALRQDPKCVIGIAAYVRYAYENTTQGIVDRMNVVEDAGVRSLAFFDLNDAVDPTVSKKVRWPNQDLWWACLGAWAKGDTAGCKQAAGED